MNTPHNIGVAARIGTYSDALEVAGGARWLALSGTPGLDDDGAIPSGFEEQATLAWSNVCAVLAKAGFEVGDLVKITQYLTSAGDIEAHAAIRAGFLGDARPASMLVVVPALVWPELQIEVEAWAARSDSARAAAIVAGAQMRSSDARGTAAGSSREHDNRHLRALRPCPRQLAGRP